MRPSRGAADRIHIASECRQFLPDVPADRGDGPSPAGRSTRRERRAQNRDSKAVQLELDEPIRSIADARNQRVDLEDCTDEELEHLQREFRRLRNNEAAVEVSQPP